MKGGDVGIIGQRHGHTALTEGLLNARQDGVVEALDLLRVWLAAEKAGDLRAVVPCLGIAGRDGILQGVRAIAEIDKRINGTGRCRGRGNRRRASMAAA